MNARSLPGITTLELAGKTGHIKILGERRASVEQAISLVRCVQQIIDLPAKNADRICGPQFQHIWSIVEKTNVIKFKVNKNQLEVRA